MGKIALQSLAVAIAAALTVTSVIANTDWTNLTLKYSTTAGGELIDDPQRLHSWFGLPLSVATAVEAGWVEATDASDLNVDVFCLPDDHHVCILFNSYSDIAGYQYGVSEDELEEVLSFFDVTAMQMYVSRIVFGRRCWTLTILFESPDTIEDGGSPNTDGVIGGNGIWIQLKDGFLVVPGNLDELDSTWIRGNCLPSMGLHLYYNTSMNMECKYLEPIFLLYNDGVQTGVGLMTFGKMKIIERDWFEPVGPLAINYAIPNTPICLVEGAETYGYSAIHSYFVNEPWKLKCEFNKRQC